MTNFSEIVAIGEKSFILGLSLIKLQEELKVWSEKIFGNAEYRGPVGPLKHLAKEAAEAAENPQDIVEYADCLIILIDACWRADISLGKLLQTAHNKMEINRNSRKWSKTNPDGPVEHIRETETK